MTSGYWIIYCLTALVAAICAFGWLNAHVVNCAILRWLVRNKIPVSADSLKDDLSYVWKQVFKIK